MLCCALIYFTEYKPNSFFFVTVFLRMTSPKSMYKNPLKQSSNASTYQQCSYNITSSAVTTLTSSAVTIYYNENSVDSTVLIFKINTKTNWNNDEKTECTHLMFPTHTWAHVHTLEYTYMHKQTQTCLKTRMWTHACMLLLHVQTSIVHAYTCTQRHKHVHAHTRKRTHTYACTRDVHEHAVQHTISGTSLA